jgi:colicin import membrane protein
MSLMKKIMLFIILGLVGCHAPLHSSDCNKTSALDDCKNVTQPGKPTNAQISAYAVGIQTAVEVQFPDASQWQGKSCTIRIAMQRDGSLADAKAETGDKDFCEAALTAVKKAKFPEPPNDEIYQMFKNAPLDFRL